MVNPWLFYMAEVWALNLYIIWTKCIPDHFSSNPVIMSCCALVSLVFIPGRDQSSLCCSLLYKNYLVTNFSQHTNKLGCYIICWMTHLFFFINEQSVCYILMVKSGILFINLFIFICFQYHQYILYIGSLDKHCTLA